MLPAGTGDVGLPVAAQESDSGVAQGGHHLRDAAGADLGVVFGKGDIAHIVGAILDDPVGADPVEDDGGVGAGGG